MNYHTLSSEKYYIDKLEAEDKVIRRYKASQTIKTMFICTTLFCCFAVCGYALYMTPSFVPDSINFMRTNGILSY